MSIADLDCYKKAPTGVDASLVITQEYVDQQFAKGSGAFWGRVIRRKSNGNLYDVMVRGSRGSVTRVRNGRTFGSTITGLLEYYEFAG